MPDPKIERFQSTYTDLCGACKAEGRVWRVTDRNPHTGEEKGDWKTCQLCGGTGLVSVTKTTVVSIIAKELKPCSKNE
jgi:hypothetical protein